MWGIENTLWEITKYRIYGELQNTLSITILVKHNLHTKVESNGKVYQNDHNSKTIRMCATNLMLPCIDYTVWGSEEHSWQPASRVW
jgi:hypothetical protein